MLTWGIVHVSRSQSKCWGQIGRWFLLDNIETIDSSNVCIGITSYHVCRFPVRYTYLCNYPFRHTPSILFYLLSHSWRPVRPPRHLISPLAVASRTSFIRLSVCHNDHLLGLSHSHWSHRDAVLPLVVCGCKLVFIKHAVRLRLCCRAYKCLLLPRRHAR